MVKETYRIKFVPKVLNVTFQETDNEKEGKYSETENADSEAKM